MTTIDEQDVRGRKIEVVFPPGTQDLAAAIRDHAARLGTPAAQWARDILLAAAGHQDTARRRIPRHPNQQPRDDRQTDRNLTRLEVRVSAREKTAIQHAAGGSVSDWARMVLEDALSEEGRQT